MSLFSSARSSKVAAPDALVGWYVSSRAYRPTQPEPSSSPPPTARRPKTRCSTCTSRSSTRRLWRITCARADPIQAPPAPPPAAAASSAAASGRGAPWAPPPAGSAAGWRSAATRTTTPSSTIFTGSRQRFFHGTSIFKRRTRPSLTRSASPRRVKRSARTATFRISTPPLQRLSARSAPRRSTKRPMTRCRTCSTREPNAPIFAACRAASAVF